MSTSRSTTVGIDIRLIGKGRTGDEVVFFQLVRELVRRQDSDIRYQLFTDENSDDRVAALRLTLDALGREDIEIISLWAPNRFIWNIVSLPWRLFRHPTQVFHTQYILPFFLPRRIKIVTHIHDVSFWVHPEWIGIVDRIFLALLMPRTLTRSDRLIVPSEFTRSQLLILRNVPAERVVVIENAAAEEWYEPIPSVTVDAALAPFGLKRGGYFLSSGTMQPRKNIPFLIAAHTLAVKKHGLAMPLVLTGNPAGHNVDQRVRKALATDDGTMIHTDYVSDSLLRALVAGAAAYVFPSLYEGFGIPIEEALAQGTPVLAADIPALREVGRDRVQYFDPTALVQLADTLYTFSIGASLLNRQQKSLAHEPRIYSWTVSAQKLNALYHEVMVSPF